PVVEVRETTGVLPPMAEAGVDFAMAMSAEPDDVIAGRLSAPGAGTPMKLAPEQIQRLRSASAKARTVSAAGIIGEEPRTAVSSVQAQTRERQLGDLFEYGIEKPVTV